MTSMSQKVVYYIKKCVICTIAVFFTAVGIELFLLSDLGLDSVSVFVQGLQQVLKGVLGPQTTYGTASLIFNCSFLALALVISRKHVFVGTVISAFFLGNILNVIEPIMISWLPVEKTMLLRVFLMVFGQLVLCMAIALMVAIRFGQAAPNAVLFKISDWTGVSFKWLRIIFEAVCVVVGWLLGGIVGLGTVFCVLTTGPIVSYFTRLYNRTFLKAIGLDDPLNEMKPEKKVKKKVASEEESQEEEEEDTMLVG